MRNSFNVKMTFAAGAAKVDLKTTIMKNGSVVNPATLTQAMLNFCASIAANKARRLKNTIVGFTANEITVELPDAVDLDKLEEIVTEEVASQLGDVEVDIELETNEEDYIQEFSATTDIQEVDPLEDANEAEFEEAEEESVDSDPIEEGTLVIASTAAESAADPIIADVNKVESAKGITADMGNKVEIFSAKDVTGRVHTFKKATNKVSVFASGDKTSSIKGEFFNNLKK